MGGCLRYEILTYLIDGKTVNRILLVSKLLSSSVIRNVLL